MSCVLLLTTGWCSVVRRRMANWCLKYVSIQSPSQQSLGDLLLMLLNLLSIKLVQCLKRELEVGDQSVTSRLCEVLAHNDAHQLHLFRVWRHGVGGDNPAALAELVGAIRSSVWIECIVEVTYTANSSYCLPRSSSRRTATRGRPSPFLWLMTMNPSSSRFAAR